MRTKKIDFQPSGVVISTYLPRGLATAVSEYLEKNKGTTFSEHAQEYWRKLTGYKDEKLRN